jgi:outer membrane protein OmpA-like peptidoglycan-associated protein
MTKKYLLTAILLATSMLIDAQPLQSPTAHEITRHLTPKAGQGGATRTMFGGESRDIGAHKVSVDLLIQFEFDSAELTPEGMSDLEQLSIALKGPNLRESKFVIEGHTDAVGTDAYNMDLSLRRARSVIRYLMSSNISAQRLTPMGYGSSKLYDPRNPNARENRRVSVVLKKD